MTDILISQDDFGCRAAIIEDDDVYEILHEQGSIVGNIYLGSVVRVMPAMSAAFVDIGERRTAFLPYKDKTPYQGERIIVQVVKDAYDAKGATVSANIRLISRYLIYLPNDKNLAVSSQLANSDKERLLSAINAVASKSKIGGGFVVRTAASDLNIEALSFNVQQMYALWNFILAQKSKRPACLYKAPSLPYRMMMDMDVKDNLFVDSQELYQELSEFALLLTSSLQGCIHYYSDNVALFDKYGVHDAQNEALQRMVSLPSGGSVVIDECEAMTVIDVNTDEFIGRSSGSDVALKTNLEAIKVIIRQLRLRNIGGMILVDFINVHQPMSQKRLINTFKEELFRDPKTKFVGMTKLGLMELTRERTSSSLVEKLCSPCPVCDGMGFVKNNEQLLLQLIDNINKNIKSYQNFTIYAHGSFINYLCNNSLYEASINRLGCNVDYKESWGYLPQGYQILMR